MPDTLFIGDRAYSSWSLRGWLLFENFGLTVGLHHVDFTESAVAENPAMPEPSVTVPTLVCDDGAVIWDSLALAEELASRHPQAGIWPHDPAARATARSLAAEMHSGFSALRGTCPMNLRDAYTDTAPGADVLADLARLQRIWRFARTRFGGDGPWLCGRYSAADVFFAPVAARIAGYDLPVEREAAAYVAAHLADPAFRRWRAMALVKGGTLERYAKPYDTVAWPGPAPLRAEAIAEGTAENETCPYSGKSITDLARIEGRVFGFCNPFCRDKTVADPAAWPAFMALFEAGRS